MFYPLLVVGTLAAFLLSSGGKKTSTQRPQLSNSTGFLFTCSSIKLIDKSKFYDYIDTEIRNYLLRKKLSFQHFEEIDVTNLILDLFKKINPTCYTKFNKQILNSQEKFAILIFLNELANALEQIAIENQVSEDLFITKMNNMENYLKTWMNAKKEFEDFENIYNTFQITYKYP